MLSRSIWTSQSIVHIEKKKKESLPTLRDHSGHSSVFIFSYSGVQQGEIQVDSHVGSGGVQGGHPGSSAWEQQHSGAVCQSS